MQTVSDIIDALGGTGKVAEATGAPATTVSSWKAADKIPHWRLDGIRKLARKKGVALPEGLA